MSGNNVEVVLSELKSAGIRGTVQHRGKHLAVRFSANGRDFQFFTAATPSDVRAVYNERAEIRRMLRTILAEAPVEAGFSPMISVMDSEAFVSSRDVAQAFDKRHDNVLRDIDNLLKNIDSSDVRDGLFRQTLAPDAQGIMRRSFDVTRDGFALLAMGFTGAKAIKFKLAYMQAFNAMERALHRSAGSLEAQEALARLAQLQGEVEALTDIVLSLPIPTPATVLKNRPKQFVRPSVVRKMRRYLS